jgi:uncharacterized protein YbjT (DUF2867 family)
MILVVGATGLLGSEICRRLRIRTPVRALVRGDSPRAAELKGLGVEIVQGDLKDPDSLAAACRGARAVISTASSTLSRRAGDNLETVDRAGQLALVAAAQQAGVQRFVFVSVSPNLKPGSVLLSAKREVERAIRNSGMVWTILQPTNFMEIWFGQAVGWNVERGQATIFGNGKAPISWISAMDVAQYAVVTLDHASARNRDIPLGGPESLAPDQVLQAFESASGRKFKARKVPALIPRLMRTILKPFDQIKASIMDLGFQAAGGDVIDMVQTQKDFQVTATSVSQYAQAATRSAPHTAASGPIPAVGARR